MSRSTWACELKFVKICKYGWGLWSRSTWACELKFNCSFVKPLAKLSRSTWACELKCFLVISTSCKTTSRSTWACELKCIVLVEIIPVFAVTLHVSVWVEIQCPLKLCDSIYRHAPRERVSWNLIIMKYLRILFASRSTWACELKCCQNIQVQVLNHVTLHVSVWVEMKTLLIWVNRYSVTLHVSVWVEIHFKSLCTVDKLSRSTWACELKFSPAILTVSSLHVTLHVSVWVEILIFFSE